MRSKENMFRRAAEDDLRVAAEAGTSSQIAEIKEPKNKAEIRRKILGRRDIAVQSAKDPVVDNKEFFSSRKNFNGDDKVNNDKKPVTIKKKFETDRSE